MRIPSAPGRSRHITPHIRTLESAGWGGVQRAQYTETIRYRDPNDVPPVACIVKHRWLAKGEGAWEATFRVPRFGRTEILALTALIALLEYWDLAPTERAPALAVVDALAQHGAGTPWELRPFGIRGKRPARRTRVALPTGGTVLVHPDTYQPHRDPDCRCPACLALAPIRRPAP